MIKILTSIKYGVSMNWPTSFNTPLRLPLALAVGLLWVSAQAAASTDGALYKCPRNLFTNQINAAQAQRQGCSPVAPGRLTQGLGESPPLTAVPAAASDPLPAAVDAAVMPPRPVASAPARAPEPAAMRVDSSRQRARDQDAQTILRSELARTQLAQQGLQRAGDGAARADHTAALNRLRQDEAALRRELSRFNP
jgi:hypothetical protein